MTIDPTNERVQPLPADLPRSDDAGTAERERDLGFGSVVSREATRRLLNRDGSFNVERHGLGLRSKLSLYHSLLTMTWPRFLALCATHYFAINLLFGAAYLAAGPRTIGGGEATSLVERAWESFFFSIQTFSTVGYGHLYPATGAANLLMTFESLAGLLSVALVTGLVFARFSRPVADIVFSQRAIVAPYQDGHGFMFRIANRRRNQIVDLEAKVILTLRNPSRAGHRHFHDLSLERRRVHFFPLAWTIVHPIDESSALFGVTEETLCDFDAEFIVLLSGFDETFSQVVHTRTSYKAEELLWNVKFRTVFEPTTPPASIAIDLRRIHEVEPADDA